MSDNVGLSVVIPAYNEELGISKVLDELQKTISETDFRSEIIVVDDGSEDKTVDIVRKRKEIILIQHPINKGYGAAIKTGIKNAEGEFILIIDGDGTYDPKDIPRLLGYREEYDMVVGARLGEKVKIPLSRKPGKLVLSLLANYLTETKIPDLNSGLRIFKKEIALRFFNLFPSRFSFTTTITLAFIVNEYSIKYIPIDYHERKGESKINVVRDGLNFILLIIRTIMYFNPLKVFLPVSFVLLSIGLGTLLYGVIVYHNISDLPVMLILASIQVGFFGLIADLIVKRRID